MDDDDYYASYEMDGGEWDEVTPIRDMSEFARLAERAEVLADQNDFFRRERRRSVVTDIPMPEAVMREARPTSIETPRLRRR